MAVDAGPCRLFCTLIDIKCDEEKVMLTIKFLFRDVSLDGNDAWLEGDAEYTMSKTSLAAVWPTLRHGYMKWSVVHGDNVNRLAYKKNNLDHLDYWDFDCALPEVQACGSTYVSSKI